MNNVSLIGRITKDIELRKTNSGISVISMFVAVNEVDKDGNNISYFPKVVVFGKTAENLERFCGKGSLIGIAGKLQTRTWDNKDGTKGYETLVAANKIQFLDTKSSKQEPVEESKPEVEEEDPYQQFAEENEELYTDLPF